MKKKLRWWAPPNSIHKGLWCHLCAPSVVSFSQREFVPSRVIHGLHLRELNQRRK